MSISESSAAANWISSGQEDRSDLAEQVAAALATRIKSGEFTEKDVDYMERLRLRMVEGSLELNTQELEHLRRLCQLWDINLKTSGFTSHRTFVGPIIIAIKRLLFPVVKLFMRDTLRQQREFNAQLIVLLTDMLNRAGKVSRRENTLPN